MNKGIRFTDKFKQDAVAQVVERGFAVSEVAERLGICTKSLYTWKAQFAKSPRVRSDEPEVKWAADHVRYVPDRPRNCHIMECCRRHQTRISCLAERFQRRIQPTLSVVRVFGTKGGLN